MSSFRRRSRARSPRQDVAVLVQEASGGLEPELVDALQHRDSAERRDHRKAERSIPPKADPTLLSRIRRREGYARAVAVATPSARRAAAASHAGR